MARKKQIKAKEPVRIRFKQLANGNQSIYLDIYTNGKRRYEFLKLYLCPGTTNAAKIANANTLQAARAIQAQRVIEIANGKAGIKTGNKNLLLVDWLKSFQESRAKNGQSQSYADCIGHAIRHIEKYNAGRNVRLVDVDEAYCRGFIDYLTTAKSLKYHVNAPISKTTQTRYFTIFVCALREAKRQKLIGETPTEYISSIDRKVIKPEQSEVMYLTIDELKAMIAYKPKHYNKVLRNAFLFACFTGLRISDIRSLTWNDVFTNGGLFVHKRMIKTRKIVDVPLPESAFDFLPNQGAAKPNDLIFPSNTLPNEKGKLPTETNINILLRNWAKGAGVDKHITFHTARHTYATMLITQGVDLYTVQKLLGHTDPKTTMIYAEIVGAKKRAAVGMLDNVLIGR